jgi:hypothetical protein
MAKFEDRMQRGKFPGPLTITEIDVDLEIWRIEQELLYARAKGQQIITPAGFHSNGASIPDPIRIVMPRWGIWRRPAVQHDYWYWRYRQTGNWGPLGSRKEVDHIFSEALWSVGVDGRTQGSMYLAVRLGGGFDRTTTTTRMMDKLNGPDADRLINSCVVKG